MKYPAAMIPFALLELRRRRCPKRREDVRA
jgi:hypothetical protein